MVRNVKAGDIVLYRDFLLRKQGKVICLSKDGKYCIIKGKIIKVSSIYKIINMK
jgi:hypothetical protein